jgi:hypothetical protein
MEKDYKVISQLGTDDLEREVKAMLDKGWQLHGNVVVTVLKSDVKGKALLLLTQAVVKK